MMLRVERNGCRGATSLVEVLIAAAVLIVFSALLLSTIHTVSVLSAKTSAININHQALRRSVNRAVENLRQAVSLPQLVNTSLATQANGPAAGVSFQILQSGVHRVWNNTAPNQKNIRISGDDSASPPVPGMRLIVPAFHLEQDIAKVGGFPGNPKVRDIQLTQDVGVQITTNNGSPFYAAYYTRRAALVVVGGVLRYYPDTSQNKWTEVARNVTNALPFTISPTNNQMVQMDLAVRASEVSNRGYRAMDVRINTTIPIRYRLTTKQ